MPATHPHPIPLPSERLKAHLRAADVAALQTIGVAVQLLDFASRRPDAIDSTDVALALEAKRDVEHAYHCLAGLRRRYGVAAEDTK